MMNKAKYNELFAAFEEASMKEFLKLLFEGVPIELKDRLIIQDVSYHRLSPEIVTLEAWMVIDYPDSEQWIWVRVECDSSQNTIKEQFLTKDSYRKLELHSLEECLDFYERINPKNDPARFWQFQPIPLPPETNQRHIMDNKKLKEGMLALQLEDEAWKELSRDIPWTEDLLERYKDKVDWEAVCNNSDIHWSVAMLEKFRKLIDWTALSNTRQVSLLTPEIVGQFKTCWDWTVLSSNDELPLETIDAMADCINWKELVNRYDRHNVFGPAFFDRFAEYIPASALKGSRLWNALVDEKIRELQKNFANI